MEIRQGDASGPSSGHAEDGGLGWVRASAQQDPGITIRQSFLQVSIELPNWGPRMCECPCQRVALVLGKNEFVRVSLISER